MNNTETREIILNNGQAIIVDAEDYDYLSKYRWYIGSYGRGISATTDVGLVRLARYLTKCPKGLVVDHINGDQFDNRKSNLRICTQSQNSKNRAPERGRKYKGAAKQGNGLYRSQITHDKNTYFLGLFNTEEEAALAYNEAAKRLHGEFARLNKVEA